MIKMRLHGTLEEIEGMSKDLSNHYKIMNKSKLYKDRNSDYYRIYIDVEVLKKGGEND